MEGALVSRKKFVIKVIIKFLARCSIKRSVISSLRFPVLKVFQYF